MRMRPTPRSNGCGVSWEKRMPKKITIGKKVAALLRKHVDGYELPNETPVDARVVSLAHGIAIMFEDGSWHYSHKYGRGPLSTAGQSYLYTSDYVYALYRLGAITDAEKQRWDAWDRKAWGVRKRKERLSVLRRDAMELGYTITKLPGRG